MKLGPVYQRMVIIYNYIFLNSFLSPPYTNVALNVIFATGNVIYD